MEKQREPGYYRVKEKGKPDWEFGWYDELKGIWLLSGVRHEYIDDDLEIDPHRIDPNPDHVVESNEKIKLPGYKKLRAFMNQDEFIEKTTWNACLDEVKRLNKIKLNNLK